MSKKKRGAYKRGIAKKNILIAAVILIVVIGASFFLFYSPEPFKPTITDSVFLTDAYPFCESQQTYKIALCEGLMTADDSKCQGLEREIFDTLCHSHITLKNAFTANDASLCTTKDPELDISCQAAIKQDFSLCDKLNYTEEEPEAKKFCTDELPKIYNLAAAKDTVYCTDENWQTNPDYYYQCTGYLKNDSTLCYDLNIGKNLFEKCVQTQMENRELSFEELSEPIKNCINKDTVGSKLSCIDKLNEKIAN